MKEQSYTFNSSLGNILGASSAPSAIASDWSIHNFLAVSGHRTHKILKEESIFGAFP